MRDLGGPGRVTLRLRDSIRSGLLVGPRLLVAGRPITTTAGHCHYMGRRADGVVEVRRAVRELCNEGVDVIKIMVTGGMMTPGSNPKSNQFTIEELTACVTESHRLGRRVAGHVLCSAGLRAALTAGIDTIEHCWTITGVGQDYDSRLAALLANSASYGSLTAHSGLRSLLPGHGNNTAELRRRLMAHAGMRRAGVRLIVHSDAGTPGTYVSLFAESIEAFMVGLETEAAEAIRAATEVPAAALGLDGEIGSVVKGKVADFVVVEGENSERYNNVASS